MIQRTFAFFILFTFSLNAVFATDTKIKCYKCDSSAENCIKDLTKVETADCDQQCFTDIDENGKVTRGCKNQTECTGNCKSCTADNCNNLNICQTCLSTDSTCATSITTNAKFNTICEAKDTKCVINIKDDKTTERHCAKEEDLKNCPSRADKCTTCDGGNCNVGAFPANRLRCYQCNSSQTECANVNSGNEKLESQICALYDANDKCYMYAEEASKITRGCVSDLGEQNKCKSDKPDEKCLVCDKANCNDPTYKRRQTRKCVQCNSKDDPQCKWGQDAATAAKDCKNEIVYNAPELCYTQTKDDVVYRGCLYDREESLGECKTADGCTTCSNEDGCNKQDELDFSCIRCRSDNYPACFNDATTIVGGKCRNPVTPDNAECFHGVWDGVAIRGCLVDADVRVQATCKDNNNNQCKTCKEKNCNTLKSSGAASLSFVTALTTLFLAYLVQLF